MYQYSRRIGYSDLGNTGRISPGEVVDLFQDCSTFQTEDLGIGISYMQKQHRAWIMAFWQMEFFRYPGLDELLDIATYPYKLRGPFGYRCFTMKDQRGSVLAQADSLWVFMNMENGAMVRTPDEIANAFTIDPRLDMEKMDRKVKMPEDLQQQESFRVRQDDIDTNGHVNNAVYVKLSQEYVPQNKEVRRLRAEYKNSAQSGDRIVPFVKQEEDLLYVNLCREDGCVFTSMEFGLEDRKC